MKRKNQKAMALLMVTALSISSVFTMPASAKSAKPKLSKKRITMWAGTKKKVAIKNAKAVKLPIGFVFDTEYLKNNTNISFDSTYMRNEEDFTEVCDEKSRRKVEKIMQQRIIDFYREYSPENFL